jgi:hypothetical protein
VHVRLVRTNLLGMLVQFMESLSGDSLQSAAVARLVAGGAVELTMGHMADAGQDELVCGIQLFEHFLSDDHGREKMNAPAARDQLVKWIAKWLPKVCLMVVPQWQ